MLQGDVMQQLDDKSQRTSSKKTVDNLLMELSRCLKRTNDLIHEAAHTNVNLVVKFSRLASELKSEGQLESTIGVENLPSDWPTTFVNHYSLVHFDVEARYMRPFITRYAPGVHVAMKIIADYPDITDTDLEIKLRTFTFTQNNKGPSYQNEKAWSACYTEARRVARLKLADVAIRKAIEVGVGRGLTEEAVKLNLVERSNDVYYQEVVDKIAPEAEAVIERFGKVVKSTQELCFAVKTSNGVLVQASPELNRKLWRAVKSFKPAVMPASLSS
jgi:hypothetical protein